MDTEFQVYSIGRMSLFLQLGWGNFRVGDVGVPCHPRGNLSETWDIPQVGRVPVPSPFLDLEVLGCVCAWPRVSPRVRLL